MIVPYKTVKRKRFLDNSLFILELGFMILVFIGVILSKYDLAVLSVLIAIYLQR